ncbi:zinc finger protein 407 [Aulostomus maculatus]
MDKTLMSRNEVVEDKVSDEGGAEDTKPASPGQTATPDKAAVELEQDVGTVCTVCDFSAKCPRSLKIHHARKHGKNTESTDRTVKPAEDRENMSDATPADIEQEVDMETESSAQVHEQQESNPVPGGDVGISIKDLTKKDMALDKQANQEEVISTQERRVSKRTPKPKIIYSCNYCGQEFRDKSPLDVHVQRYHTKATPYTFDEQVDEEEEAEDPGTTVKTTATQVVPKRTLSRFQLKCTNCDFRVSTPALLESHARVKHPGVDWYRCRLCNFFSATSDWMDTHLSSDGHKQHQNRFESTESSPFEEHVERVSRGDGASIDGMALPAGGEGKTSMTEKCQEMDVAAEVTKAADVEEEDPELEPPRKKRGRPPQDSTNTCGYCGLVVSNSTNLSVHVRRKHSKEYGYSCTLCNYSCVTKGDMDRHCITKKHIKRAEECAAKNSVNNHRNTSPQEPTTTQAQEPNAAPQTVDDVQEAKCSDTKEHSGEEQTQSDTSQKTSKYDSVNACSHCDFVAQSIPSLHLHVKRKHTKDFEYVCLACSYYAVTSREMSRHANTEKHKQKSQKYLESSGNDGRRALPLPLKLKQASELTDTNSHPECEPLSPNEGSESDESQEVDQNTAAASVPMQPADAAVSVAEKVAEQSIASYEPDPTTDTEALATLSEPQQSPELQPAVDTSAQQEGQGGGGTEADVMNVDTKSCHHSDIQMSKAVPFDACIVSIRGLAEQEQAQLEELALEGEAAVICLTGGSPVPPGYPFRNYAYVTKPKPKETKVRDEGKASNARIRCEDCGFMADGISGLNVHISMKHPSKEKHFHCLVCGKSFYTESNLHQHLTSAAHLRNEQNSIEELPEGGANFKCVKCTDRFATEQDLFIHIKEKHEELLREVNKYVLEDTEQINREREENQGNVCKYCGKVCKSSNSMAFLAHIRTHTGSKPFICKICNFATAQLGDARNHVKRHLGMREYKCDICGWAFVMKKHLSNHLLGKHGVGQRKERKFECKLCERSFSEKWALNNHMKLHSGEKPYKCAWPSCHYSFLNLSAMKDHYRTHTGEKSYLCDLCGFAGGTRHALTKHRRQHTGERPFKCKLCNFASTTQSHLSRHKRVHTGEKPYRCPWCDYRSNCAENIRKHILHTGKHEGVKMYNCPKCNYATNAPMEFRNHLKETHSDIENPDLAYLHAGIVSKSFECRLKGQGATFVESESMGSPVHRPGSLEASDEPVQQVIIIQGYGDGDVAIDQALEESAAATLQTLAMAGQVAEVVHITEDGQVIASGREVASAGARLAGGSAQYVVLESGEARDKLRVLARGGVARQSHIVPEPSTALDALLNAVSEVGHQEEMQTEAVQEVLTPEMTEAVQSVVQPEVKQEEEMQEVLQLAASQMMKEGLTQVIVNDEGTHYIVTELDNCTLQVEGGVYDGEAAAGDGGVQQAEQQAGEEMVVYLDGAPHNIVLEG